MPKYFAYGANMDVAGMAERCPKSKLIGPARLMRHSFIIMKEGWASVVNNPGGVVYGLLWDLSLSDIASLDRFEGPLYSKISQPVIKLAGGATQALLYIGSGQGGGKPNADYAKTISQAAELQKFPHGYRSALHLTLGLAPPPVPEGERLKVRPRFASPLER